MRRIRRALFASRISTEHPKRYPIVRSVEVLNRFIASDPYAAFRLSADAKRIVTFARVAPQARSALPIEIDDARILAVNGREVIPRIGPAHGHRSSWL